MIGAWPASTRFILRQITATEPFTRWIIKLNVRTYDEAVRRRVLSAIERIVNAEAAASGAPKSPEISVLDHYPLVNNDAEATSRVTDAFRRYFSKERVREVAPTSASEDFGSFGTGWHAPNVFWFSSSTWATCTL